jgi:hypothetical protein
MYVARLRGGGVHEVVDLDDAGVFERGDRVGFGQLIDQRLSAVLYFASPSIAAGWNPFATS